MSIPTNVVSVCYTLFHENILIPGPHYLLVFFSRAVISNSMPGTWYLDSGTGIRLVRIILLRRPRCVHQMAANGFMFIHNAHNGLGRWAGQS